MIQGFETRESTDIPIRAFVKSANGILHKKERSVNKYEQTVWKTFKDIRDYHIAVFGILRGTGELIKQSMIIPQTFYHFDHAYYGGSKHTANNVYNEKIYRITKNDLLLTYIDKLNDEDYKRIEKYKNNIKLKSWNKKGDYILVLPPSEHVEKWYNIYDWEKNLIFELKKFTDREIKVRKKDTLVSFKEDLQNAHALVTHQSVACVEAIIEGVPSFCDKTSCGVPVSLLDISQIETPFYPENREEWLDSLLANQFTMNEIENGTAWNRMKNK